MKRDITVKINGEQRVFRPRKNCVLRMVIEPNTKREEVIRGYFLK